MFRVVDEAGNRVSLEILLELMPYFVDEEVLLHPPVYVAPAGATSAASKQQAAAAKTSEKDKDKDREAQYQALLKAQENPGPLDMAKRIAARIFSYAPGLAAAAEKELGRTTDTDRARAERALTDPAAARFVWELFRTAIRERRDRDRRDLANGAVGKDGKPKKEGSSGKAQQQQALLDLPDLAVELVFAEIKNMLKADATAAASGAVPAKASDAAAKEKEKEADKARDRAIAADPYLASVFAAAAAFKNGI